MTQTAQSQQMADDNAHEAAPVQPNEKLLTLVVPAYNMQDYLPINIQSVLQARHAARIEVLIINDGSTDATLEVARAWEAAYPHIVHVVSKPNGHYGSAINCGIDQARGRFLKILDADDSAVAAGLDALLEAIMRFPTVDLFITDYLFARDEAEEPFSDVKCGPRALELPEYEPFAFDDYVLDPLIMHSLCYRSALLRDARLGAAAGLRLHEGRLFTDEEFATKPLALVDRVVYVPCAVYRYVVDRAGQSIDRTQLDRTMDDNYFVVKSLFDWYLQLDPALASHMSPHRRAYLDTKIAAMMVVHVRRRLRSARHDANRAAVVELTKAMDELPYSLCEASLAMQALRTTGFRGYRVLATCYGKRHAAEPI